MKKLATKHLIMKKSFFLLFLTFFFLHSMAAQEGVYPRSIEDLITKDSLSQLINFSGENCQVFSFHLILVPNRVNDKTIYEVINKGNKLEERTKELLKKAKKGAKIYVEKIESLGDCIEYQFRNPNFIIDVL